MNRHKNIPKTPTIFSRLILAGLTVALATLGLQTSHAVLVRESQIVNVPTGVLGAPGIGTAEGWGNPPGTGGPTVTNGAGSLIGTNLGLIASEGDRVFIGTVSNLQTRNQFLGNVWTNQNVPSEGTNLYFSFLYKFNDVTRIGGTNILVRVNKQNSGTGLRQFFDVMARRVGDFIQVGIAKGISDSIAITNWAGTNISAGATIFLVVRYHLKPGWSNDVAYLWVNPPAASFGAPENNLPPPSAVAGDSPPYGDEDATGSNPGRFAIGSGVDAEFDELRIGTTWADVTPWFGMCVNPTIVAPPTNMTIAAGLSAT
ncbi:MAG: hypothetical protein RMH97_04645, partial [Verrucomicrobiales bacterium]|nr:hypothetical protein [Verrucomicrobiales bacterium]